ncbi:hypothetical protein [Nonomuraea jabiensis]|uniref:hypothetical protein n=1 Tax=Nonomuraea jabiensis TaxID=882448 RepID=UPI003D74ADEF
MSVKDDWIIWPPSGPSNQRVPLPPDFYLREFMTLSADDLDGVADMMKLYGEPFHLDGDELPPYFDDEDEEGEHDPRNSYRKWPEGWDPAYIGLHRDLVRAHLDAGQNAVRTWLACQEEHGLERLVEPEVTAENLATFNRDNPDQPGGDMSLDDFREFLVHARLADFRSVFDQALSGFSVGLRDLSERFHSIYGVMFLQLYNHMLEHMPARRCASETCDNLFVYQRGRSQHGQHRSQGVKYCSTNCARAQAARELRRRRRAAD